MKGKPALFKKALSGFHEQLHLQRVSLLKSLLYISAFIQGSLCAVRLIIGLYELAVINGSFFIFFLLLMVLRRKLSFRLASHLLVTLNFIASGLIQYFSASESVSPIVIGFFIGLSASFLVSRNWALFYTILLLARLIAVRFIHQLYPGYPAKPEISPLDWYASILLCFPVIFFLLSGMNQIFQRINRLNERIAAEARARRKSISALMLSEENLRISEARFRAFFSDSPMPMRELDLMEVRKAMDRDPELIDRMKRNDLSLIPILREKVRILMTNRACVKLLNLESENSPLDNQENDPDNNFFKTVLRAILSFYSGKKSFAGAVNFRKNDGTEIYTAASWYQISEDWSRVILWMHDVTEQNRAMMDAIKSREAFRSVFYESPIGMRELNMSPVLNDLARVGKDPVDLLENNPAEAHRIFSLMKVTATNNAYSVIFDTDNPEDLAFAVDRNMETTIAEMCRNFLGGSKQYTYSMNFTTAYGEVKHVEGIVMRMTRDWSRILTIVIDRTELKKALDDVRQSEVRIRNILEKEVSKRTEDLELALLREKALYENLEVALLREKELNVLKSSFVSVVSHEFRTPLAVIQSSADLVAMYGSRLTEEQRMDKLNKIRNEVRHMTDLMEDVLFFEKSSDLIQSLEPEPIDFFSVLQDIILDTQRSLSMMDRVNLDFRGEKVMLLSFDVFLRRVIGNLISNALRYSTPDSEIYVVAEIQPEDAILIVRNEGRIDPTIRNQIFEPFVRVKDAAQPGGTGLGLAITRKAVEACGGEIQLLELGPPEVVFSVRIPVSFSSVQRTAEPGNL